MRITETVVAGADAGRAGRHHRRHVSGDGELEDYDLPTPESEPHGLTVGPDGAVYVALETGSIARLER